jgi:hypothetical protein
MHSAVLSDLHGNADALLAGINDLRHQSPGPRLTLGDCFSGPLAVVRTADTRAGLAAITVCGTLDRALFSRARDTWNATARPRMPQAALHWLATRPTGWA